MLVIYGTRLYGKVNETSDGKFVASRFAHIWYVPLIPLGSVQVEGHVNGEPLGHKIDMHGKSVFAAYLRLGCILSIILGVLMMGMGLLMGAGGISMLLRNPEAIDPYLVFSLLKLPLGIFFAVAGAIVFKLSFRLFSPNLNKVVPAPAVH